MFVRLFKTIAGLRCYLNQYHRQTIGLVPTMGALHSGHLSLIQQARRENAIAVVSIFVNPLQFAPTEDLQRYPRTLEQDQELCEQAGVDVIFAPSAEEMGADSTTITAIIPPATMTAGLCGKARPGHFQGVATIVTKLLNVVQPTTAYFGQKDAQQVAIIKRLIADLNLPVNIVVCPIVRETSGLALSSRNQYLNSAQQQQATVLYRALQQAEKAFRLGERQTEVLIAEVKAELAKETAVQLEYIELVHPDSLMPMNEVNQVGLLAIAARLDNTRLIDNVLLRERRPIVAIDGPAGAGKSTVARQVAQNLGLLYLDTGAMYRAVTWLVLESGIEITDEPAIAELVSQSEIQLIASDRVESPVQVTIQGRDVTDAIRSLAVTAQVSAIAAQPAVRQALLRQQQRWGEKGGIVAEGRDIGTCVFPDAEVKIFLTASVQERARRRHQELIIKQGTAPSLEDIAQAIADRDRQDSTRAIAPLQQAPDAIELITDGLTIPEVIARIVSIYQGNRE
jgi:pantoate ligase/cytidylate kinase